MNSVLGIFGGTFDPIHCGHLELARELREALGLSAVRFIPAGDPPHRAAPVATPAHRLAMVELAVEGQSGLEVDAREIHSAQRSYTVPTLEELREEDPSRTLALIVGADSFSRPADLAPLARRLRSRAPRGRAASGCPARNGAACRARGRVEEAPFGRRDGAGRHARWRDRPAAGHRASDLRVRDTRVRSIGVPRGSPRCADCFRPRFWPILSATNSIARVQDAT